MDSISRLLTDVGSKLQNLGYVLKNPQYLQVRQRLGSRDIFRLLNRDWLHRANVRTVLDVGCNEGQFLSAAIPLLPNAQYYAFDPNLKCIETIKSTKWDAHVEPIAVALGEQDTTVPLNVLDNPTLSSLLKPNLEQLAYVGGNRVDNVVDVPVKKLDTIMSELSTPPPEDYLLKLDVQGYEDRVFAGASETLKKTAFVISELCLSAFYEGQSSASDIFARMSDNGFSLIDVGGLSYFAGTDNLMYLDLVFKNNSK